MKDEDKKWLIEEFPKYMGKTIRGEVLKAYYEAERILAGKDQIRKRGCSCELRGMATGVDKSYNKWLQNEKDIHNE